MKPVFVGWRSRETRWYRVYIRRPRHSFVPRDFCYEFMGVAIFLKCAVVALGWMGWIHLLFRGVTYIKHSLFATTYLVGLNIVVVVLFFHEISGVLRSVYVPSAFLYVVMLLLFPAIISGYFLSRRFLKRPTALIVQNPKEFNIPMEYSYIMPKSLEILFQQIVITLTISMLIGFGWTLLGVITLFVIVFGLVHLPEIGLLGRSFGVYYITSAAIGGVVFPWIFVALQNGPIYAYIIHWLFYLVSGIAIWIWNDDRINV